MNDVLYICNKKAPCNKSKFCGSHCNLTTRAENAANFTAQKGVMIEKPRPQQVTMSWKPIGGTDDAICPFCNSRMKNKTSHGKIFRMCPICGTFMNIERNARKNQ